MLNTHTYTHTERNRNADICVTTIFLDHHWLPKCCTKHKDPMPYGNSVHTNTILYSVHMWSHLNGSACSMFNQNQNVFMGIQVCIKHVILHFSSFQSIFSLPWNSFNQIDWQPYALSQNRVQLNTREYVGKLNRRNSFS